MRTTEQIEEEILKKEDELARLKRDLEKSKLRVVGQKLSDGNGAIMTILAINGDMCDIRVENTPIAYLHWSWSPIDETAPDGSPGTIV